MALTLSDSTTLPSWREKISAYLELSKSGIVTLVVISVLGGYLVGQPSEIPLSWTRMAMTLIGVLLLSAGSSALNQIQEIPRDARMPRTANRPLPSGRISISGAWVFVIGCMGIGAYLLALIDPVLLALGALAVISYNGLYTLWWKRRWSYAAIPGAIPGALPILMGHYAAAGHLGAPSGIYLFLLLFFWQMPHFWVLALRFRADYERGDFPTLPVTHGPEVTIARIVVWCLAYVGLAILCPLFMNIRGIYCIITFAMSAKVIWEMLKWVKESESLKPEGKAWLRFFLWVNFSLIVYIGAAVLDLWSTNFLPYFTG